MTARLLLALLSLAPVAVLGQAMPTEYWSVTPWEMWAATPAHARMCGPSGRCYSSKVFADQHLLGFQDNGFYGVISVLEDGGVGVVRDFVGGELRCFSDVPGECSPSSFPPGRSPGQDFVPVLSAPGVNSPTPGATIHFELQITHVNFINPATCTVSWGGWIVHSGSHFLLDSYDFGPPVGVLSHVYVTEEGMGCPATTAEPMSCARLERYFFAPGLGRIRQEGWNDPLCDGEKPDLCRGDYSVPAPGAATWIPSEGPPVAEVLEVCP